jgi:TonB family protein
MKFLYAFLAVALVHIGLFTIKFSQNNDGPKIEQTSRKMIVRLKQMIVKPVEKKMPLAPAPKQATASSEQDQSEQKKVYGKNDLYLKELSQLFAEKKKYPSMAKKLGVQGIVKVSFTIMPSGQFKNISLVEKNHELLNRAALSLVNEVNPFKPFPKNLEPKEMAVTLPISYTLN